MLSGRELALGIVGAWRLVRADRTALLCFDRTPRGFWRSFWVILLLAPIQALLVTISMANLKIDPVPARLMVLEGGIFLLDWLLLPAILSELALRRSQVPEFIAFTVAYNYAQILMAGFWLAIVGISAMLPDQAAILLQLLGLGLLLFYQYRIARITFDADRMLAAMVVLLSLGLSLLLQSLNGTLLAPFIPGGA